jgi:hypothetical protein
MRRNGLAFSAWMILAAGGLAAPAAGQSIEAAIARYDAEMRARQAQRAEADRSGQTWLALGDALAADAAGAATSDEPTTAPARNYVHWRQRVGPAYPGDFWQSLGRYAKEMPATVWDDTKATFTNPTSLVLLGLAGGSGLALSGRADDRVEEHFARHGSGLNTFWDTVGDAGGNPGTHFAVAGAMLLTSLAREDTKNFEKAKTMMNALAINGMVTMALKVAVRTESPNGDEMGWPSGHTSSAFAFATVMHHEYGPWVGVPLLAFASYVGYERFDARNHDFSDVISGALIGLAIGHAVCENHQLRVLGMDVLSYADPRGGAGVMLARRW